jgi:hypothetical protein
METSSIEKAHDGLVALAREGGFGEPEEGEWNASQIVAHIIASYRMVTDAGSWLLAGLPARLDNRLTQSLQYLGAIVAAAGDWDGLIVALDQAGGELLQVVGALDAATAESKVAAYLVHADAVRVDGEWVFGDILGDFHTIGHTEQLAALRTATEG